jgi:hypothetical protein
METAATSAARMDREGMGLLLFAVERTDFICRHCGAGAVGFSMGRWS